MNTPCPGIVCRAAAVLVVLLAAWLAGCADSSNPPSTTTVTYANRVLDYSPEIPSGETLGAGFYDSSRIVGSSLGSLDVVSLGSDSNGPGGSITVGLGADDDSLRYCIQNGEGADFIVHENPFSFSDSTGDANFTDAAYVEVSEDSETYYRFSATFPAADASLVGKPESYANMAGITVGGDGFDLTDLITDHSLSGGFTPCYVRIVDGGADVPDYSSSGILADNSPSGADIAAVESLYSILSAGLSP